MIIGTILKIILHSTITLVGELHDNIKKLKLIQLYKRY